MNECPDNYDLWRQRDANQQRQLDRLPKCTECGEPIQQTDALFIDGGYICDDCLDDMRREILLEY